jgi:hypothetical protein
MKGGIDMESDEDEDEFEEASNPFITDLDVVGKVVKGPGYSKDKHL